jgi:hypothetical protein
LLIMEKSGFAATWKPTFSMINNRQPPCPHSRDEHLSRSKAASRPRSGGIQPSGG